MDYSRYGTGGARSTSTDPAGFYHGVVKAVDGDTHHRPGASPVWGAQIPDIPVVGVTPSVDDAVFVSFIEGRRGALLAFPLEATAPSGGGGSSVTVSDDPPSSPSEGDLWYESDTGKTFVYYDSGWVEVGGAAATPRLIEDADADTKIQVEESADEDQIRFDTAGSERMVIDASGNVTIGASDFTVDTDTLYVDGANDRVGIGTTSPAAELDVSAAVTPQIQLTSEKDGTWVADDPFGEINFYGSDVSGGGAGYRARIRAVSNDTYGYEGDLTFHTTNVADGDAERVRITDDGRVGIGTTTPETPINIVTTNKLGATFTGTTDGEGVRVDQSNYTNGNYVSLIEGSYNDTQTAPHVRIASQYTGSGSLLHFGTSNAYSSGITNQAMTINQSGYVGLGTTSPDVALDVLSTAGNLSSGNVSGDTKGTLFLQNSGGAKADGALSAGVAFSGTDTGRRRAMIAAFQDGTDGDPHGLQFFTYGATSSASDAVTSRMTIGSDGKVGIGTTSPDGEFELTSNTSEMIFSSSPNKTNRYRLDANISDSADFGFSMAYWDGSAWQRTLTIDDSGKVGIGTTSPAYMLDVRGDVEIKEASPTLSLKDSDSTGSSNGSIVFRDSADTVLGRIQMNGNDDMGIQAVGAIQRCICMRMATGACRWSVPAFVLTLTMRLTLAQAANVTTTFTQPTAPSKRQTSETRKT